MEKVLKKYNKDIEKVLPKFWIHERKDKRVNFEWDYQSSKPEEVLMEQSDYISGYVKGFLTCLNDSKIAITCLSGNTATISNMKSGDAEKLLTAMKDLLITMVNNNHLKLLAEENDIMKLIDRAREAGEFNNEEETDNQIN